MRFVKAMSMLLVLFPLSGFCDDDKVLSLLIDADFSNSIESSEAIERGVITALSEVDGVVNGARILVERMDHRGNVTRSKRNIKAYKKSPVALAMISGLHSSPLLAHRELINKDEILFLDPWAAAGPITRYPSAENWIFRLSIDDSKAGEVIVAFAVDHKKTRKPCLLLENTGWGESNLRTMSSALADRQLIPQSIIRFNWGLKLASASALINICVKNGADSIYMVANSMEGASLARAVLKNPIAKMLPIFSHWGITGGAFQKVVSPEEREGLQLYFLQTQFSFLSERLSAYETSVLNKALLLFEDYKEAEDIQPVSGFVHAYDLTRLLLKALEASSLDGPVEKIRREVRANLERINQSVTGLIKIYSQPFSPYSKEFSDAHEALDQSDFAIGMFTDTNVIVLYPWAYKESSQ